jgi:1,3-beta-glucan synthase
VGAIATLAKFSYVPTTYLTRRLLFFIVALALTAGPTFYIAIAENQPGVGGLTFILGIAQFLISIGANMLFGTMHSSRMFSDKVVFVFKPVLVPAKTRARAYGYRYGGYP